MMLAILNRKSLNTSLNHMTNLTMKFEYSSLVLWQCNISLKIQGNSNIGHRYFDEQ